MLVGIEGLCGPGLASASLVDQNLTLLFLNHFTVFLFFFLTNNSGVDALS